MPSKTVHTSSMGADLHSSSEMGMPVMQFKVAALINDSVGTLAGGCYVDADTKIGVILGTGTNACYAEQRSNIAALAKGRKNGREQQHPLMAINTEWGNFAAPSSPFTDVSPPTAAQAQALPGSAGDAPALSARLNTVHHLAHGQSLTLQSLRCDLAAA